MATHIFGEGPTGDQSGNHKDTYVDPSGAQGAFPSAVIISLVQGFGGSFSSGLMRFDVSAIPATDTVVSATLRLFLALEGVGANRTIGVHDLSTAWGASATNEGATENPATGGQATYQNAFDYNDHGGADVGWAAGQGVGFGAGDYAAAETSFTVNNGAAVGTAYDIQIPTMAASWIANAANNAGLALIPTDFADFETLNFDSQNSATAAERPILTVVTAGGSTPSGSAARIIPSRTSLGLGLSL